MKGFVRTCLSASYPLTSSSAKQSSKFQVPSGAETIQGLLPSPPSEPQNRSETGNHKNLLRTLSQPIAQTAIYVNKPPRTHLSQTDPGELARKQKPSVIAMVQTTSYTAPYVKKHTDIKRCCAAGRGLMLTHEARLLASPSGRQRECFGVRSGDAAAQWWHYVDRAPKGWTAESRSVNYIPAGLLKN